METQLDQFLWSQSAAFVVLAFYCYSLRKDRDKIVAQKDIEIERERIERREAWAKNNEITEKYNQALTNTTVIMESFKDVLEKAFSANTDRIR